MLLQSVRRVNKKLSHRKQIARQQRAHSNNSKFSGRGSFSWWENQMGPGDGGRCWKRNISLCGSFFTETSVTPLVAAATLRSRFRRTSRNFYIIFPGASEFCKLHRWRKYNVKPLRYVTIPERDRQMHKDGFLHGLSLSCRLGDRQTECYRGSA